MLETKQSSFTQIALRTPISAAASTVLSTARCGQAKELSRYSKHVGILDDNCTCGEASRSILTGVALPESWCGEAVQGIFVLIFEQDSHNLVKHSKKKTSVIRLTPSSFSCYVTVDPILTRFPHFIAQQAAQLVIWNSHFKKRASGIPEIPGNSRESKGIQGNRGNPRLRYEIKK